MLTYAQIRRDAKNTDFDSYYAKQMLRLESQRARLMDYLDKQGAEVEQKITIERLLTDIDTRLLASAEKVEHSKVRVMAETMENLNEKMEEAGKDDRYITLDNVIRVSPESWTIIKKALQKEGILKK